MYMYKVFEGTDARQAAGIALKHRLYVPRGGWILSGALSRVRDGLDMSESQHIILAYDEQTPIGVCLITDSYCQFFVRKIHRRRGVGKDFWRHIKQLGIPNPYYDPGTYESKLFFSWIRKNK